MARAYARDRLIAKLAKLASVPYTAGQEDISPEDGLQSPEDIAHAKAMARLSLWGWCCVKTTAEYGGFVGVTYLGACSYDSADDFVRCEGHTQTYEACAALLDNIQHAIGSGKNAQRVLSNLRAIGGK